MGLILRSPLAYPGGIPRHNPSHFAATAKLRYSGVASGANLVSLLNGSKCSVTGTITAATLATGPCVVNNTSASKLSATSATETHSSIIAAAIYTPTSHSNNAILFDSNGGAQNSQSSSLWVTAGALKISFGSANSGATLTVTDNVPYFIAGSVNLTAANLVVVNLNTGQRYSSTSVVSQTARTTVNSTYVITGSNFANQDMTGSLAAIMYSVDYLTLSQLLQWAQAPWDFWYPPTVQQTTFSSLGMVASTTLSFAVTDVVETASFTLTSEDDLHFALTDAVETASFNLTSEDDLSFPLTDAVETASFTLTSEDDLHFALTDAVETASFTLTREDDLHFALTDAVETASFTLTGTDTFHFALTDAVETAAFTLTSEDDFHFALTDAVETASFQVSHSLIQVPTGHPNRAPRLRERVYRHRLLGRSQDPTIVVTKDRPGPLRLIEVDFWMD